MAQPFPYAQLQATATDLINNVFALGTVYKFLRPTEPPNGTFTQYGSAQGVFSVKENVFVQPTVPSPISSEKNYLWIAGTCGFVPEVGDRIELNTDATKNWRVSDVINYTPLPQFPMAYKIEVM